MKRGLLLAGVCAGLLGAFAHAEDGYDLWLRYRPLDKQTLAQTRPLASAVVATGTSPTALLARDELVRGLSGMLARPETVVTALHGSGEILIGTPASSPLIAKLGLPLEKAGDEALSSAA